MCSWTDTDAVLADTETVLAEKVITKTYTNSEGEEVEGEFEEVWEEFLYEYYYYTYEEEN